MAPYLLISFSMYLWKDCFDFCVCMDSMSSVSISEIAFEGTEKYLNRSLSLPVSGMWLRTVLCFSWGLNLGPYRCQLSLVVWVTCISVLGLSFNSYLDSSYSHLPFWDRQKWRLTVTSFLSFHSALDLCVSKFPRLHTRSKGSDFLKKLLHYPFLPGLCCISQLGRPHTT